MYVEVPHQDRAFSGNLEVTHILPRFINDHIATSKDEVSWIHFLNPSSSIHPKT